MKNRNFNKISFNLFFILITFFHVIKFESEVYSVVDYFHYPNLPTVELVVHPKLIYNLKDFENLSPSNSITFKKDASNYFQSLSHKYLFKLSQFSLVQQFPDEQVNCSPTHKIITFLQKKHLSHSSEDDHLSGYRR